MSCKDDEDDYAAMLSQLVMRSDFSVGASVVLLIPGLEKAQRIEGFPPYLRNAVVSRVDPEQDRVVLNISATLASDGTELYGAVPEAVFP